MTPQDDGLPLHEADDETAPVADTPPAGPAVPWEPDQLVPTVSPSAAVPEPSTPTVAEPAGAGHDELVGTPVEAYSIGEPGRAAKEVVPSVPGDPSDPADTQCDGGVAGELVVRAASCRGIAHRHAQTPRQDDYAICATDRWLILAVADGVSAGSLSHQAATLACRSSATLVRDALVTTDEPKDVDWMDLLSNVARRILSHGRRVLATDDVPAESVDAKTVAQRMATTLAVAMIRVSPNTPGVYDGAVVVLGDTSAFLLNERTGWTPVTAVKNDGALIASSATAALPYLPQEAPVPSPVVIAGGSALILMSDGVGDPLGRGDGSVGEHLAALWSTPPDPLTFAAQVGFARKSFDDDRTVVGVWSPR